MTQPSWQILVAFLSDADKLPTLLLAAFLVRRRFSQSETISVEHPMPELQAFYVDKGRVLQSLLSPNMNVWPFMPQPISSIGHDAPYCPGTLIEKQMCTEQQGANVRP
jgi:hypothetical protein